MSNANHNSKNYYEFLKTHYKAVFSIIIAAIPIIGAVITFLSYIYQKEYLSTFGVNEDWIDVDTSKSIYNIIYKGCLGLIILLPNSLSLAPLLFTDETHNKVKYEFWFTVVGATIVGAISWLITRFIEISIGRTLLVAFAIWIITFEMPVISSIIINAINFVVLLITHPRRSLEYFKRHFKLEKIRSPFKSLGKMIDKADEFYSRSSSNITENERVKNKNIALYILVITFILIVSVIVLFLASYGETQANAETNFRIIELSQIETYDEAEREDDLQFPYIQSNRRVVNSRVILSENDKYYLIANSYYDYNDFYLYVFSNEQMIVEKKDTAIKLIELPDGNHKNILK